MIINKISSSHVVDYAAEELKKYLYMMMPEKSNVEITRSISENGGFCLGLMSDFELDCSDVKNSSLDDVIYIDCKEDCGIIAGSNERSVLIAVYEYLRRNGCRWLFPGVDGEYIPIIKELNPVKYRHVASGRFRGPCIEGAVKQQILLDTIDFLPKVGMNSFTMQFFAPTAFYNSYYWHTNSETRSSESVSTECIIQWKRAAEAEMAKRGLAFYDVGHGWAAAPFGIDCSSAWDPVDESVVPEASRKYLAEFNGRRGLFEGSVLCTQFCMSNPEGRSKIVEYLVDYARKHSNVSGLLFALADNYNNHCECEKCEAKTVSDWYVILLNEIDDALTKENIPMHIIFFTYTETNWAPVVERIKNPDRFTLQIAPIDRKYTETLTDRKCELAPFVRNKVVLPRSLDESMAHFRSWSRAFDGDAAVFEYYFWRHQVYDLSGQVLAKRIFEDIEVYLKNKFNGLVSCGSQRSYFPNGFAYYVFARKLFDNSLSFDEIAEDYYYHAYGDDWKEFYSYLSELELAAGFAYLEGECSEDESISPFYSPKIAENIKRLPDILEHGRNLIASHYNSDLRVRTVSVRVLEEHANYVKLLAEPLYLKAIGDDDNAIEKGKQIYKHLSEREPYIEQHMDMLYMTRYIKEILEARGVAKRKVVD